ncbi:hypothetical protein L1887_34823 [Cichorium endivia]|nr:hypothetical protein L1887_34823 [Cichorium endivia]
MVGSSTILGLLLVVPPSSLNDGFEIKGWKPNKMVPNSDKTRKSSRAINNDNIRSEHKVSKDGDGAGASGVWVVTIVVKRRKRTMNKMAETVMIFIGEGRGGGIH